MNTTGARIAVVVSLAILFSACAARQSAPAEDSRFSLSSVSAVVTDQQRATQSAGQDPLTYGWMLFVYANWPALAGQRGVPDPSKKWGSAVPVVWQTWKSSGEVYVNPDQTPLPWDQQPAGPPVLMHGEIDGRSVLDYNQNPVMYQVNMNHAAFDYLMQTSLYRFDKQEALRTIVMPPPPGVAFPADAMEIKASWRILDPVTDRDVMNRYLTQRVQYYGSDCTALNVIVGLTGLHIISKALPNWYWVTFEQVDNATTTQTKLTVPIPPNVATMNTQIQQIFAGTPWQYYQMNGYQTDYNSPTILANSQMETNFQSSSSCMTCHSLSSIGLTSNPQGVRFQFFNNFQGYTGNPPADVFGPGPGQYTKLDYVWSMREAKARAAAPACNQ
jgi:hypothetical protein